MRRKLIAVTLSLSFFMFPRAQTVNLPVNEWKANNTLPFILYISGDGGMNKYSTGLCEAIHSAGYSISAINAKTYFWEPRTPKATATDINEYLLKALGQRTNQQFVLAGYSFGADVIPFVVNNLPVDIKSKLISVVLLSPSRTTDFEIHILDILGGSRKRNMDVVTEINKMNVPKTVTIFGSDETDFPVQKIQLVNHTSERLPGGHHFDGNMEEVAKLMMKHFR